MIYGSVCSGIEAASVAWEPLGWQPSFFSEIEAFPRAVLAHRWPEVKCHGDFTTIRAGEYSPIDLLVGGTPCQSFSVAGLRGGLADERGNLALEYLRLAQRLRPRWLVWENVPGVLSSAGGRDFGSILGGLVELGYGFAYRVLDAQYVRVDGFGRAVPQRRRRVFLVGHLGDWRRAAAVLLERESLRGNPPPSREPGQGAAPTIAARTRGGGGLGTDAELDGALIAASVAPTLNAHFGDKMGLENQHINEGAGLFVAHALRADGFDASEDGTGRGTPIVPVAYGLSTQQEPKWAENLSPTLAMPSKSGGGQVTAVAIQERAVCENPDAGPDGAGIRTDGAAYTLEARTVPQAVAHFQDSEFGCQEYDTAAIRAGRIPEHSMILKTGWRVRRLTPTECERLQGFPEILDRVTINVWHFSDLHQNSALAESLNLKSQNSVLSAEGSASLQTAESVDRTSRTRHQGRDLPVALNVLINSERGEVQISKAGKLIWSASTVAKPGASPLPLPTDAFVRLAALMTQTAVPQTLSGRVELPPSIRSSSPALLGSACVNAYGHEIAGLAADAEKFTTALESSTRSITSPSGQNSQNFDWSLRTLSSCVTAAISSCIQNPTIQASSYSVIVESVRGYTDVPYRGKPTSPDGPRYKALGNSMAVNCMRWIGRRIEAVDRLEVLQAMEAA